MDLRKSRGIGIRTRRNILKGKTIRKDKDGGDVFEDYWTDSEDGDENSTISKKSGSTSARQTSRSFQFTVVRDQQLTNISAVANSKTEFLKSNEAELENTIPKAPFEKKMLLLKEVSEVHPKNAVQMQNILPGYDDLDLEIMQMCQRRDTITDKNELSHLKNLSASKANKKLLENSKSFQEKGNIEEMSECTDELPSDNEYDLDLFGKKLQNASYVSPIKHLNEKDIANNSSENSESDATVQKNLCSLPQVSPDKGTSNVSINSTKLKKNSPSASKVLRNSTSATEHLASNATYVKSNEISSSNDENLETDNTVKNIKRKLNLSQSSPNKNIPKVGTKSKSNLQTSFSEKDDFDCNIHTRSKSASISLNKDTSNISLQSNAGTNCSEHNQSVCETNNCIDNSFKEVNTKKRRITGKKLNEKEQIQPINATSNCIGNSVKKISTQKKKTRKKTRNKNGQNSSSDHIQPINVTNNSIGNSINQISTQNRKTIRKNGKENEHNSSPEHIQPINSTNNFIDDSFKQIQKRKPDNEKGKENKRINSSEQAINAAHNSNNNSFEQLSTTKRKTIMKKRTEKINSTKKQKRHSLKSKSVLNSRDCIRKSSRQRFPPLARWRNERVMYHYVNGDIEILGVDKGTNEDDKAAQFLFKRYKTMQGKKKVTKLQKAGLVNVAEDRMLTANVIKKFSLTPWSTSNKQTANTNQSYLIKRMFETEKNGFGFLQLGVDKEKPEQYMPDDDLHLTVIRGNIELTIQKNSYEISEKDMFIIPRNCAYKIKNVGRVKALLSYVVGKFQFLESLKS